jgi:ABC-type transport system involved in multi-copper enzyme maturation permease subunit
MNTNLTIARQMVGAELLKLRKKRSLLAWSLLLAAGSVALVFVWKAIQHASDPGRPPAGGLEGFRHGIEIVGLFIGPLAAVLIGAEAGAGDSASGVFRDLVVTGRSRVALFAARIPGALLLCLPVIAVAYVLLVIGTFLLAGGSPTPSAATILDGFGWALLVNGAVCVVAVGLASLTTSRPATITTLIGFELVASPLLLQTSSLGSIRKVLLDSSVLHLAPTLSSGAPVIPESLFVALLVIGLWLVIAGGLGAWRTATMDA